MHYKTNISPNSKTMLVSLVTFRCRYAEYYDRKQPGFCIYLSAIYIYSVCVGTGRYVIYITLSYLT